MNTHTKKLFDQALDQAVPETWTTLSYQQITKLSEVFAQLIVQECAGIAHGSDMPGKDIKEHFGVEL